MGRTHTATSQNPVAADPFSGPSDRAHRSLNTITGKRGVDKKHNSYARYLGRRKAPILRADMQYGAAVGGCGNTICCCECQQLIRVEDTGNIALQNAQVGDIVTQNTDNYTANGVIIAIERNTGIAGDLDRILVKVDDCATKPFISSADGVPPDTHIIWINGLGIHHHVSQSSPPILAVNTTMGVEEYVKKLKIFPPPFIIEQYGTNTYRNYSRNSFLSSCQGSQIRYLYGPT